MTMHANAADAMAPRDEAGRASLPNLVIIGAMKSGTSSLHRYLDAHPDIFMSRKKELKFFVARRRSSKWSKSLDWYRAQFEEGAGCRVIGESTPEYSKQLIYPGVPGRMHSVIPRARLVYILRDPIERMVSHYVHLFGNRKESRSLEDALLSRSHNKYVDASLYHLQLERYLEFYPRSQIFVTSLEGLVNEPVATMQSLFRFVGVDDTFSSDIFARVYHASSSKRRQTDFDRRLGSLFPDAWMRGLRRTPIVSSLLERPVRRPIVGDRLRRELEARLADDVTALRSFTGEPFAEWSV